ncbi:hypothetical protein BO94DRAFT_574665 [Aspergillus sclerotioniger CBS 115572]|uniref:FAS1 domain-containing protein n=1 Tax=Aspergillus sclerotioniger CBS 115572 TaxID=1450535 RepID=A0A317WWC9_9EURO|nr:hypothetical protein BO94DRAFT_574665 [Aspergillus sclerotioniger CBS 115572]PWY88620.1 hypothetical protein BO94DRAFT_574665 [Aspergillus sclerotioniger CBS 115572]
MKLPLWPLVALPLSAALHHPQVPLQDATNDVDIDIDIEPDLDNLDLDSLTTSLACALHHSTTDTWSSYIDDLDSTETSTLPQSLSQLPPPFRHPSPPPFHRHPPSNKSLYDLILSDPDTTILAKFISHDQDLTDLLNTTSSNLTFFAPTDDAIRRIHHHYLLHPHHPNLPHHQQHLLPRRPLPHPHPPHNPNLRASHPPNTPSTNSLPQRLTIHPTWKGLTLNFYAHITSLDHRASNGNLYHIDSVLLPPLPSLTLLNLVPTEFSTFVLALYKTGLDGWLNLTTTTTATHFSSSSDPQEKGDEEEKGGLTLFIPNNVAFEHTFSKLTSAWLFNSPRGLKYLAALVKYHIVPRETLYSDTLYRRDGEVVGFGLKGLVRVTLKSLLSGEHCDEGGDGEGDGNGDVIVDVGRFGPYASLRVNGFQRVKVADLVAEEGNGHVLDRVLVPPRRVEGRVVDEGKEEEMEGEIGMEELKRRLVGFVDEEDEDEDEFDYDYMGEGSTEL